MPRPQFRLKSLFVLTSLVAVACLVGPPIVRNLLFVFIAVPFGLGVTVLAVVPLVYWRAVKKIARETGTPESSPARGVTLDLSKV